MKPDPKSNQQIFDYVVTKLAEQGRPAIGATGLCQYRGKNGCKCAVGWLISDHDYDPVWEEKGHGMTFSTDSPQKLMIEKGYSIDLLTCLQDAHDSAKKCTAAQTHSGAGARGSLRPSPNTA